jgi:DNA-binding phage protein
MQNPTSEAIAAKFLILRPLLDERARRVWAALEARAMGRGGISRVAEATGLSRVTIRAGLQELRRLLPNSCAVEEEDASP